MKEEGNMEGKKSGTCSPAKAEENALDFNSMQLELENKKIPNHQEE